MEIQQSKSSLSNNLALKTIKAATFITPAAFNLFSLSKIR